MRVKCGVCQRNRRREECKIVVLTPMEKLKLESAGHEILTEYVYCRPCWNNLCDPIAAPQFMKGLFQIRLQQMGFSNTESLANRYLAKLVSLQKK